MKTTDYRKPARYTHFARARKLHPHLADFLDGIHEASTGLRRAIAAMEKLDMESPGGPHPGGWPVMDSFLHDAYAAIAPRISSVLARALVAPEQLPRPLDGGTIHQGVASDFAALMMSTPQTAGASSSHPAPEAAPEALAATPQPQDATLPPLSPAP